MRGAATGVAQGRVIAQLQHADRKCQLVVRSRCSTCCKAGLPWAEDLVKQLWQLHNSTQPMLSASLPAAGAQGTAHKVLLQQLHSIADDFPNLLPVHAHSAHTGHPLAYAHLWTASSRASKHLRHCRVTSLHSSALPSPCRPSGLHSRALPPLDVSPPSGGDVA